MTHFRLPLILATVSIFGLAACQPPLPGQENTNTQTGVIGGALLGGAIGAISGSDSDERLRNAAIGATIGGTLGGIGGNQLDRQEAELRQQLGRNVGIVNDGTNLTVTMPQDILFAVDSAVVNPGSQADLRTLSNSLNAYPNSRVVVVGHTDSTGSAAHNQALSERRANSVAAVLIQNGVSPSRIRAVGRGEDQPIATNQTPEGRALNRRVEIIITPM
ncbi:MAG: OmpA family protein [Rubellimicrobium sp.]|nr:OmpA family protein [Rubellimicrobium sp.]